MKCQLCDCCCFDKYIHLQECEHVFCKSCIKNHVVSSHDEIIRCPYGNKNFTCQGQIQDGEIVELDPDGKYKTYMERVKYCDEYERIYECKNIDCKGWWIMADKDTKFHCPECKKINCLVCQDIHESMDCAEFMHMTEKLSMKKSYDRNRDNLNIFTKIKCVVCLTKCQLDESVMLKNCQHAYCKKCLKHLLNTDESNQMKCLYKNGNYICNGILYESEIKSYFTENVHKNYVKKVLHDLKICKDKMFKCKTENCIGYCVIKNGIIDYVCPFCEERNCLRCKVIHSGLNCTEYKALYGSKNPLLVDNKEFIKSSECPICLEKSVDKINLQECLHLLCKKCFENIVRHSVDHVIKCPHFECDEIIEEFEIRLHVDENLHKLHLKRSIKFAQYTNENVMLCKTPNCEGWCFYTEDENVYEFICEVCGKTNCIKCQAVHENVDCDSNQLGIQPEFIGLNIMQCPVCKNNLSKDIGCDWLLCAICKTELCWATKGLRWGPTGKGDTSGGCRCMVNGFLCHIDCQNCH